ncbi:hypothetical protein C2W64_00562 [Brevibacillus laterosporus]|nr:hypothetical protein C2W64_00562 [Brevibacillus laterosporus]
MSVGFKLILLPFLLFFQIKERRPPVEKGAYVHYIFDVII